MIVHHNRGPTLILMILAPELRRSLPCKVPMSAREAPRQLARPSALRNVFLSLSLSLSLSAPWRRLLNDLMHEPLGGGFK